MPRGSDLEAGRKIQYNRVLTYKCVKLIERIAAINGLSEAGVIETLVREKAYELGLEERPSRKIG